MAIVIDIGERGLFRLSAPFETALNPGTIYECKGVRRLSEMLAAGEDTFEKYYAPYSIGAVQYQQDLDEDISIVSLCSDGGHWVYVPNDLIQGYPDVNGIKYKCIMLGVSLGAIPDSTSLVAVKASLSNVIKDALGIDTAIEEMSIADEVVVSHSDHESIETARAALITTIHSDRTKLIQLQTQYTAALARIADLENYIKANYVP